MAWKCPRCYETRAVFDLADENPRPLGCIDCGWHNYVGSRCISPTMNIAYGGYEGRCSRDAILNGMCWQHANKGDLWDVALRAFRHRDTEGLPETYREVFTRACIDAGLLQRAEASADRVADLAERAFGLRAQREARKKTSVVYFVRREGLIKIGTTVNLNQRVRDISKGSCMPPGMTIGPVELLTSTTGDRELERRLHDQFWETRVDGTEWFRPSPRLLRLIARYQRRAETAELAAA